MLLRNEKKITAILYQIIQFNLSRNLACHGKEYTHQNTLAETSDLQTDFTVLTKSPSLTRVLRHDFWSEQAFKKKDSFAQ